MRLATIALFFCLPAFGQGIDRPTFDFATGQGKASADWLRINIFGWTSAQWPNASGATWYASVGEAYSGDLTVTVGGRQSTAAVQWPLVAVTRTYQLNSVFSASGVVFNGYSGNPTITGAPPVAGDPYTVPLGYPAGSYTAVWKTPVLAPQGLGPFQLFATVGGNQSTYKALLPKSIVGP